MINSLKMMSSICRYAVGRYTCHDTEIGRRCCQAAHPGLNIGSNIQNSKIFVWRECIELSVYLADIAMNRPGV